MFFIEVILTLSLKQITFKRTKWTPCIYALLHLLSISCSQANISPMSQPKLVFWSLTNLGWDSAEATARTAARQARTIRSLDILLWIWWFGINWLNEHIMLLKYSFHCAIFLLYLYFYNINDKYKLEFSLAMTYVFAYMTLYF